MWVHSFWVSVWPNLAANVIWGAPALWVYHQKLKRHHRKLFDGLHDRLTGIEETQAGGSLPGGESASQAVAPLTQDQAVV